VKRWRYSYSKFQLTGPETVKLLWGPTYWLTFEVQGTYRLSRVDEQICIYNQVRAVTFNALQRVQNILARVVTQSARRSSAKPLLGSIHWLPLPQSVTYKLATVCYKARSTMTPAYLRSLLLPHVRVSRLLSSSQAPRLAVPRTRNSFCQQCFLCRCIDRLELTAGKCRHCGHLGNF